ncbi:Ig-like domain-containing protein, partial [Rhizobium sp. L1K21]|uniref:Ig-like domain-containing protein n=1 Tax=Rhizobium sp. L1K21 TaxID=2954933 RepID=UPI0020932967
MLGNKNQAFDDSSNMLNAEIGELAPVQLVQAANTGAQNTETEVEQQNTRSYRYVADDGNRVNLPAGTSIEEVKASGEDLIFVQPDGSEIVISGGVTNLPHIAVAGIEIPDQVIAALMENSGIEVAAGPDGSPPSARPSGNSEFDDVSLGSVLNGSVDQDVSLLDDDDRAGRDTQAELQKTDSDILSTIESNSAPIGTDGSASGDEDTLITGTIVASDVDGDSLTYAVSSNPAHGTVTLSGNGYTYTPD